MKPVANRATVVVERYPSIDTANTALVANFVGSLISDYWPPFFNRMLRHAPTCLP